MSEFKGTKGNWFFDGKKTNYADGDYFDIRTIGGDLITQVDLSMSIIFKDGVEIPQDEIQFENEMRANAKVIAAAPELLQALKLTLHDLSEHMSNDRKKYFETIIEKATL